MGEKPIKETKPNKFINLLKTIGEIIGASTGAFAFYQMVVEFYRSATSNIAIDWKGLVPIILVIVLCILLIIFLNKNKKLNNIIESQNTALDQMKNKLESKKNKQESPLYDPNDLAEMRKIGITKCIPKIKDTDYDPNNCMEKIERKLLFMGLGGAKWIEKESTNRIFRKMLLRVMGNHGEVKFLVMNPYGEKVDVMREQRGEDLGIDRSYDIWKGLISEFPKLEVKCYNHDPTFRLQLMDDRLMAFSMYQREEGPYNESEKGWRSPHLIIENTNQMSFYRVFEHYFYREWDEAINILEIEEPNEQ